MTREQLARLVRVVLATNVLLIATTIGWRLMEQVQTSALEASVGHLSLTWEMNAAAWWATGCLLLVAVVFFELYVHTAGRDGLPWLGAALIFAGLALDEFGSLHERVLDFTPMMVVAMLLGLALLTLLQAAWKVWRSPALRPSGLLLIAGFLLMASALPQEIIEHRYEWTGLAEALRDGIEEGAELMGVFLCLVAAVRIWSAGTGNSRYAFQGSTFASRPLFLIAMVLQVGLSILSAMAFEIGARGNPALFVPVSCLFVAALTLVAAWQPATRRLRPLAIVFVSGSLASMYLGSPAALPPLSFVAPGVRILALWTVYSIATVLLLRHKDVLQTRERALIIGGLLIPGVVAVLPGGELVDYVSIGITALVLSYFALQLVLRRQTTSSGSN